VGLPSGAADGTIEGWFRKDGALPEEIDAVLAGHGAGGPARLFALFSEHEMPGATQWGDAVFAAEKVPGGTWHHFAAVVKDGVTHLYVDGTLRASKAMELETAASRFYIGDHPAATDPVVVGLVGLPDEVSVYDRALDASAIAAIHAAGSSGKCLPAADARFPRIVGQAPAGGSGNPTIGLSIDGGRASAARYNGGHDIYDVADPARIRRLWHASYASATDILAEGRHAYVGGANGAPMLRIADVADPAAPVFLPFSATAITEGGPSKADRIELVGDRLYMTVAGRGLQIYDVSVRTQPSLLSWFEPPSGSWGYIHVASTTAYLSGFYGDFDVLDVADVTAPRLRARVTTAWAAGRPTLVGTTLLVPSQALPSLFVYDVSDPSQPVAIGSVPLTRPGRDAIVVGSRLYVAGSGGGLGALDVVDVSNPRTPRVVAAVATPPLNDDVVVGNLAYVA
jgi:hypothetical protein